MADEEPLPELPDGIPLRVASYNVYGGNYASVDEIAAFLGTLELDMLGLQECPGDFVAPLAEAIGLPYTVGGSGVVLFSRRPLTDTAEIGLPNGREMMHGVAEIEGVPFSLYAAHISWDAAGDVQTRTMVDDYFTTDPHAHLVLVGDFNDEHFSTQITLLEERLADAFTDFGWYPGERVSWPSTEFGGTEGAQLIDLIFYRKTLRPLVLDAEVFDLSPVLSDHKPTFAELLYPRDAETPFVSDPFAAARDPWRDFPAEDARPTNLLTNPGAEDGLAGWTALGDAMTAAERATQLPRSGEAFFTGPPERTTGAGRRVGASQTVALDDVEGIDEGRGILYASGQMRVGYRVEEADGVASNILGPNNHTEILVEVLDAGGAVLLRRSSGQRDTYAYHPYVERIPLPPGARAARLTWLGHQHAWYLGGCDVAFDDLYLGVEIEDEPGALLSGNLLANPGAEAGDLTGWEDIDASGWWALADLEVHGLMELPPLSYAGAGLFFGGGVLNFQPGRAGESVLAQSLDLAPFREAQQAGELALRWGGWLRTWKAQSELSLSLEIRDGDGGLWGRIEAEPVAAAAWTERELLTRIPPNASAVRFVLSAEVEDATTGVFADELFVLPERVAPPASVDTGAAQP